MGVEKPRIKKIFGDGLSLKLQSNEQTLEVTGDGCSITMAMNSGSVKIIGDGCRLRIDQNMGDVVYTGDGGHVAFGPKSIREKVKYVGDGGRISFDGERRAKGRKPKDVPQVEDPKGLSEGGKCSGKGKKGDSRGEEAENLLNERKEERRAGMDGNEKKKERLTRTKIVTTFEYDEKITRKWFVNPESVVRTLDGASFVNIVPKQTKTKIEVKYG